MMDPRKLLERLPRFDRDKPLRYLARRVVQAMADAATANLLLGQRSAPGRYLVLHLVSSASEKDEWEQQFAESRAAIQAEVEREARTRDMKLRSPLEIELIVVTEEESERGETERVLASVLDPDDLPASAARLDEEREIILARRVRTLLLESTPGEAQVYLDHRPLGVTPCRVDDVPEGDHVVTFSRPGFLIYEETFRIEPGRPGQKLTYHARLEAEPEMGVLDISTFPPGARVTVGGETREAPVRWRLPAGVVEIHVSRDDFEPQTLTVDLSNSSDQRPNRVQVRLKYSASDAGQEVGRLLVYKPGPAAAPETAPPPRHNPISEFFRDQDGDPDRTIVEWDLPPVEAPPVEPASILGEMPLRRGIILIGREDPGGSLTPDVRLFDPENSVSRGCHAWLWVYADTSTGATYNTFLIGNNSPAGIRVDGALVMETRRLSEDSEVEIGNFRMRLVKSVPEARVEFGW